MRPSQEFQIATLAYHQAGNCLSLYFEALHAGDARLAAKHYQARAEAIDELCKASPDVLSLVLSNHQPAQEALKSQP